jgi:proteasome lid subunit RPN8/RPN11
VAVIRVPRAVLAAIDAHARAEAPCECCGLLVGVETEIRRAAPCRNLAPGLGRYDIDPADHFRVLREVRRDGLSVLGAYHSHPASPPIPSPTDLAEGLPNFLYVIATVLTATAVTAIDQPIRAYYFEGAAVREVRLVVID